MQRPSPTDNLPANLPACGGIVGHAGEPAYQHRSVMVDDVVEILQPTPGRLFVDGTVGGGGHTAALLEKGARVVGFDRDAEALRSAQHRLSKLLADTGSQTSALVLLQTNFREIKNACASLGVNQIDGLLLDLGVSSPQLDHARRGFSLQTDGPLDMRMDQSSGERACDWIARADESQILMVLQEYGEILPSSAKRITKALVKARTYQPIATTRSLTSLVESVMPRNGKKIHPATQVFQAIRIAINDELSSLQDALTASSDLLKPGGRVVVISFHSLEDRIVKNYFRSTSQEFLDRSDWSAPKRNPRYAYRQIERSARKPREAELKNNPRSRSARLRWVVKT